MEALALARGEKAKQVVLKVINLQTPAKT